MKKPKFQTPTGTHDIFGKDQLFFQKIYKILDKVVSFYNFKKIDTPILEEASLFSKGIGISTDIVEKQMYNLNTKGGDLLTLRPEGTAPIARAYIQHGMHTLSQPVKFWYFGPFFRYEKPQSGRFRQFHQFGLEVLGEKGSVIDAQIIQIFWNILRELELKNLVIEINSIGDSHCRPYYKKALISYLRHQSSNLCSDCKRRSRKNPLRFLDCKNEKCQSIKTQAPQIIDYLCKECHNHFKEVLEFLEEIKIPYLLNPYLVRGLDYYTKTIFEIFEDSPEGRSSGALAAGGRYDDLLKNFGSAEEVPASGGAIGIERIIAIMKEKGLKCFSKKSLPKIFLAQLGNLGKKKSLKIIEEFRKEKVPIAETIGKDSLKAQLQRADKIGVDFTLILGQKEALENTVIIREMASGKQKIVKIDNILKEMKRRLKK